MGNRGRYALHYTIIQYPTLIITTIFHICLPQDLSGFLNKIMAIIDIAVTVVDAVERMMMKKEKTVLRNIQSQEVSKL